MSDESLAAMEQPAPAAASLVPAPVARQQRISSLDVLRGVAVLGILLMNIVGFALPHWAYGDPSVAGGSTGADLWAWMTTNMLFEGTMRAMFSLLFGAGVILLTSRLEARFAGSEHGAKGGLSTADIYFRRNMWLIVFGLIHSYVLLWLGDILYTYGIVGMFMYVFRGVRPSRLLVMSAVLLAAISARNVMERNANLTLIAAAQEAESLRSAGIELSEDQQGAIDAWADKFEERKPSPSKVAGEIDDMHREYLDLASSLAPINFFIQTTEFCKYSFWDAACMMLLGMALMKLGVLSGERSTRSYLAMLAIGYALGLGVNAWETWTMLAGDFRIEAIDQSMLTYDIGRVAMVIGHVGAIMLFIRSGVLRWLAGALAACGQMALSNYLMQSVICTMLFFGHGFGLYGELSRAQLYIVVAAIWTLQLVLSPLWLQFFLFGPAEWLWRSLTYARLQPLRRPAAR